MKRNACLFTTALMMAITVSAKASGEFQIPDANRWYRLVTLYNGEDKRVNACVQYVPTGRTPENAIWGEQPVDATSPDNNYQLWRFITDPENADRFALECRAAPGGYLSTIPVASDGTPVTEPLDGTTARNARWVYVAETAKEAPADKYGFRFMHNDNMSGVESESGNSYAALSSEYMINLVGGDLNSYIYMNCGGSPGQWAVNVWTNNINDERANEWCFVLVPDEMLDAPAAITEVTRAETSGKVYNLLGCEVTNPSRGIYIINGKKVLLK